MQGQDVVRPTRLVSYVVGDNDGLVKLCLEAWTFVRAGVNLVEVFSGLVEVPNDRQPFFSSEEGSADGIRFANHLGRGEFGDCVDKCRVLVIACLQYM